MSRAIAQYNPGIAWRSGYNFTKADSLVCAKYKISNVPTAISITRPDNYATGELTTTRIQDENGNVSYEFKNLLGQVIPLRQIDNNDMIDTYYLYDNHGNLRAVIPPEAASVLVSSTDEWNDTNSNIAKYCYLYKYDHRNRCIAKKLPGCNWVYYVYDKADRLIFTQDGEQRIKGEWTFSIPDSLGRIVVTGTCKNSLNYTTNPLGTNVVVTKRANANNTYKGYATPTGVTLATPVVLSVNYYDDYAFLSYNGIPNTTDTQYTTESGYGTCYGDHQAANKPKNKGLLTGTLTARITSTGIGTADLYSVMYYDNRGLLVQTKSNNHLVGGVEKEYFAYNFTGQPTKRKHTHQATGKTPQTEEYVYNYDHAGRLLKTTHKLNGGTEVILAENTYDELGRLATSRPNATDKLKKTYTYNVRSWITKINNTHFVEDLTYAYNGNIQTQQWQQAGKTRKYTFAYDALSRLKTATYTGDGSYGTSYVYDKHGNITRLTRYGNTGTSTYGIIDDLTMGYNGNQLIKVEDGATAPALSSSADFRNGTSIAIEYTYDVNGNLKQDLNKVISSITYNVLNLPHTLVIKNGTVQTTNTYVYSADGRKLSTTKGTLQTDYVGNIIYEGTPLKRILVDNGYYENGNYYFYINDHLGNNRVVADKYGNVVQSTQYYPFGMAFADGVAPSAQPYKYNGKELDSEKGLNWYDYSARNMDPALGRFLSIDPLAEKYYSISPYAYCLNNPMRFVDPTGMAANDTIIDGGALPGFGITEKKKTNNIDYSSVYVIEDNWSPVTNMSIAHVPLPGGSWKGLWKSLKSITTIFKSAKEGLKLGQIFGKLGKVVKHPGIKITNYGKHGAEQATIRGVSQITMQKTVDNAKVVLEQGNGTYLFLTEEAAVVLNSSGRVVTTYPATKFDQEIKQILDLLQ